MRAVVTGAAGFIGSHLCERLLEDGWDVVGVDNFNDFYDPQVKRANVCECMAHESFRLVEADIRDAEAMHAAVARDTDAIVHLAAMAGVRPSIDEPLLYSDVNVNGTLVMLEAARKAEVAKFIFASSSSVYGNNEKVPFSEDDNVDFPISPYAATKKACELICHTYHALYDMPMTCLRFFTVYGPRQRPDLAIHKFAKLIESGRPIPIYGDGTKMRDFTYIDDIIDGVVAAIKHCEDFHTYNLGESQPISVNDLVSRIERALGTTAQREYMSAQPGDVERTFADVSRAERELGYHPRTDIDTGLAEFVRWLRQ